MRKRNIEQFDQLHSKKAQSSNEQSALANSTVDANSHGYKKTNCLCQSAAISLDLLTTMRWREEGALPRIGRTFLKLGSSGCPGTESATPCSLQERFAHDTHFTRPFLEYVSPCGTRSITVPPRKTRMKNHYFLVIAYTQALNKIHEENKQVFKLPKLEMKWNYVA